MRLDTIRIFIIRTLVLTKASLKSRYRQTFAGFIWVVINPILMFGIQCFVFSQILNLNVENYLIFLLSGLVPWIFIVQSLEMSVSSIVNAAHFVKSFEAPPLTYLVVQLLDNFLNFIAAFSILLLIVFFRADINFAGFVYLPIAFAILFSGVFIISWLVATMQIFFKDTKFILSFFLNGMFFLTPIFYPASFIPSEYSWVLKYNVFYSLIRPFINILYKYDLLSLHDSIFNAVGTLLILLFFTYSFWLVKRNKIYEFI